MLALVIALGIPAQAVIGGITVLTDLNPWIVSLHLLCSMAIIGVAVLFLPAAYAAPRPPVPAARSARLAGLGRPSPPAWAVLYVGTVVTGAGPHAGDADAPRNGLDPLQWSQLHADVVFLLLGLTIGAAARRRSPPGSRAATVRAVAWCCSSSSSPRALIGFVAVLHRPARSCWSASTCSARPPLGLRPAEPPPGSLACSRPPHADVRCDVSGAGATGDQRARIERLISG